MGEHETTFGPVLVTERRGAVLILRLNRPEARNTLSAELLTAIGLGMVEAENDPEVRAVVSPGRVRKRSAPAWTSSPSPRAALSVVTRRDEGFRAFHQGEIAVPIIGAANATAVTGGFELCSAVTWWLRPRRRSSVPEVKRGLFAAGGGVFLSTPSSWPWRSS